MLNRKRRRVSFKIQKFTLKIFLFTNRQSLIPNHFGAQRRRNNDFKHCRTSRKSIAIR